MAVISISRDTNNNVSLVRMEVSDNLATVGSADYILNHQNEINTLNGGVWDWFMTDMLLVAASDGNGFYYFTDTTFDTLKPYGEQGSGMVNPASANSVAYYATTGSSISGITPANNGVLITSNTGVPSISSLLPSAVQANITTVGTINTGVWQGTPVTVPYGGTGDSSFTAYAVICGGTTSTGALQSIASVGSLGDVLVSNGPGTLPTFQTGVASGIINTGNVNDLAYYSVNPSGKTLSGLATANNGVLITSGLGVPSISSTLPSAVQGNITALGTIATGVWHGTAIGEIYGGTNQTTYTLGDTLYASAANTLSKLAGNITSVKQYLSQTGTGAVSAAPVWATISGGDITGAALTKTDDTNVTLTLGGTPTTALLRAASLTLGWTGQLSLDRGGTNANLTAAAGGVVYSTASALAISAVGSSGQLFQSTGTTAPGWTTATYPSTAGTANNIITSGGTNFTSATLTSVIDAAIGSTQGDILYRNATVWTVLAPGTAGQLLSTGGAAANPAWTTSTFPTTGGAAGNVLISNGTNYIASTSLWPNTVGSAGKIIRSNGTSNAYTTATYPDVGTSTGSFLYADGTNWVASTSLWPNTVGSSGKIVQSNGTSNVYTTATYPTVATSTGTMLRADGTNWVASTSTFADTYSASTLLYSNGANTVTGLATANTAILLTNGSGVPAWSAAPLSVAYGGTAVASITAYNLFVAKSDATSFITLPDGLGTSGQFLQSNGTGAYPTWGAPFGSQNVVTGSRALGTTYRNTTGKTMFVSVSVDNTGGGVGTTQAITDSSATPTTVVAQTSNPPLTVMPSVTITFMVLNNNYYKISTNVATLDYWTEWY